MILNTIEELVEEIRKGRMIILMDDEDRENEGDLIMASECCQAMHINFMAKFARGLICMPITRERCELLNLPLMPPRGAPGFDIKFTASIEAAHGVTTGISAADRAHTIQAAIAKDAKPEDLISPGHIFPLMAQSSGTLSRAGHTEAACDLARMAGYEPSGVICEIMNDDGTMSRRQDLERFSIKHKIKIGTIADLIHYRMINERTIQRISEKSLETDLGRFNLVTYRDSIKDEIHMALTQGSVNPEIPTLVRVHNMDPLRDLLMTKTIEKRWCLRSAMDLVSKNGSGIVLLLGHPLDNELLLANIHKSSETKPSKNPTTYSTVGSGSQILRDLGVRKMRLMSSPMKFSAISGFGLEVPEYILP